MQSLNADANLRRIKESINAVWDDALGEEAGDGGRSGEEGAAEKVKRSDTPRVWRYDGNVASMRTIVDNNG